MITPERPGGAADLCTEFSADEALYVRALCERSQRARLAPLGNEALWSEIDPDTARRVHYAAMWRP